MKGKNLEEASTNKLIHISLHVKQFINKYLCNKIVLLT